MCKEEEGTSYMQGASCSKTCAVGTGLLGVGIVDVNPPTPPPLTYGPQIQMLHNGRGGVES